MVRSLDESEMGWFGVAQYVPGEDGFDCDCEAQMKPGEPKPRQCNLCRLGSVSTPMLLHHSVSGVFLAVLIDMVPKQY